MKNFSGNMQDKEPDIKFEFDKRKKNNGNSVNQTNAQMTAEQYNFSWAGSQLSEQSNPKDVYNYILTSGDGSALRYLKNQFDKRINKIDSLIVSGKSNEAKEMNDTLFTYLYHSCIASTEGTKKSKVWEYIPERYRTSLMASALLTADEGYWDDIKRITPELEKDENLKQTYFQIINSSNEREKNNKNKNNPGGYGKFNIPL